MSKTTEPTVPSMKVWFKMVQVIKMVYHDRPYENKYQLRYISGSLRQTMANLSTYTKTGFQLVCLLLWQHHVGLMAASKGSLLRFFVLIRSSEISSNVFYTEIDVVNPIIILPVGMAYQQFLLSLDGLLLGVPYYMGFPV